VLFSDIRGFTSATETLVGEGRSSEVIRFLNRYTDAMTEAIFAEHGVLDKMGDGLLVLFGAPEPMPNHALLAIRSALRTADLLPELSEFWPLRGQRPLRIGIDIHSGSLMDGLVGRGKWRCNMKREFWIIVGLVLIAITMYACAQPVEQEPTPTEGQKTAPTAEQEPTPSEEPEPPPCRRDPVSLPCAA
jgi:hypothetical protein